MHQLFIRVNRRFKGIIVFTVLHTWYSAGAQQAQLTLMEAFRLSRQNFPALRRIDLIPQATQLNMQNLNAFFLPQVNFNGQASYQSDVTKIDVPLPGIEIPSQTKDQYRVTAEVSQLLFDGGVVREQKNIASLNSAVKRSSVEVELYALKSRITQLYLGILYQDALLKQTGLLLKNVQLGIDQVKPQVENGTVLRSNLRVLEAQYLQTGQRVIEIKNTRNGLINALSLLIHQPLPENTKLQLPQVKSAIDTTLNRPEITVYEDRSDLIAAQAKLTDAKNLPRASAFIQGGYGKPGLNLLSGQFDPFYIAGLRFNWSMGGLYNARRDKKLISIARHTIELEKESFIVNTQSVLLQQKAEISRYTDLVASDSSIIALRSKISEAARAQLENAVINSSDYLREINAEEQAREAMETHLVQLLQAQINYQISSGKL